jgi:hypothetical protein
MRDSEHLGAMLAVAGALAVVVGIHQGLVHVAPGYEGTITSGWGGELNHEEVLLAGVSALGVAGSVAARRFWRLAAVPFAAGGVVLFYVLRVVYGWFTSSVPLYRETSLDAAGFGGDTVMFVLGAEPFLLALGGLLLAGAGVAASGRRFDGERAGDATGSPEGL